MVKKANGILTWFFQSNGWRAAITIIVGASLGFVFKTYQKIDSAVQRTDSIPIHDNRLQDIENYIIRAKFKSFLDSMQYKAYKDSARVDKVKMFDMLNKIYKKLNLFDDLVYRHHLKHAQDSILIISEPEYTDKIDVMYTKNIYDTWGINFKIDSLLVKK